MKRILELLDKGKQVIKEIFITESHEPQEVRKKHIRLGIFICLAVTLCLYIIIESTDSSKAQTNPNQAEYKSSNAEVKRINLEDLAKGASNEKIWVEGAEKEIESVRQQQLLSTKEQDKLKEYVDKNKVDKEELANLMQRFQAELEERYGKKLEEELARVKEAHEQRLNQSSMEVKSFIKKIKIKRVGDYIPANSYAEAVLTSGVDVGVGMTAEANPRHILLRVTGELVSAGQGADYIKTKRLIGCQISTEVVGEISSEKGYLRLVLMTCVKDINTGTIIEVPVKGYITSKGKEGIRGEVVSREGDMVFKSFLAGIVGGFGHGISQYTQLPMTIAGGIVSTEQQKAKDITTRGLGAGLSSASDKLLEYFIKKAEQYQSVISINEGVGVYVVFQEGVSLTEEDANEK